MDDNKSFTAPQPSTDDPLRSANTVAVLIHGVGDHKPVDFVTAAETCVATLWQGTATTARISVPDIPLPRDVNSLGSTRDKELAAVRIQADAGQFIILPVVWSGSRFRSGRLAIADQGPVALWVALPLLFETCANLFASVRKAHGLWRLWVLIAATLLLLLLIGFFLGFFYLQVHVPIWLGAPAYDAWYSVFLALGSFYAFGLVAKYFSAAFDLVGDVAYYVANTEQRQKTIEQVAELLEILAKRAPEASIVVAGHSLGSVLVSQALLRCSSNDAARGRILLLTMGSPLRIMSRAFPDHVESPQTLAARFAAARIPELWINLWREQDNIGKALGAGGESFVERSLGLGPHSNYWGDERVWLAMSAMFSPDRAPIVEEPWRTVPLSEAEAARSYAMWRKLRFGRKLCLGLTVVAFVYQVGVLVPFEQHFSTAVHALVLLAWNAGLLPLAFVAFGPLNGPSAKMSPREIYHYVEFQLARVRSTAIVACGYLALFSGIVALQRLP
jgi:hypothetical protein